MRTFLAGRPILLDTPYFQQNIGRQRLKIIQYWIQTFQAKNRHDFRQGKKRYRTERTVFCPSGG